MGSFYCCGKWRRTLLEFLLLGISLHEWANELVLATCYHLCGLNSLCHLSVGIPCQTWCSLMCKRTENIQSKLSLNHGRRRRLILRIGALSDSGVSHMRWTRNSYCKRWCDLALTLPQLCIGFLVLAPKRPTPLHLVCTSTFLRSSLSRRQYQPMEEQCGPPQPGSSQEHSQRQKPALSTCSFECFRFSELCPC